MADTPRTNIDGYYLVMATIKGKIGKTDSPQSYLAEYLGITRQASHQWAKADGIPQKHVDDVSKLTGLSSFEIRPECIAQNIPGSIFDKIGELAKRRGVAFGDQLLSIIRKGLKSHG